MITLCVKKHFRKVKLYIIVSKLRKKKRRKYQIEHLLILNILLILFVVILSLVSLLGFIIYKESQNFQIKHLADIPVYCEDLSLSADEDFMIFDTKRNRLKISLDDMGRYICSSRNFTETIDTVVKRQSRIRLAKGAEKPYYFSCGNESLAQKSGHLTVAFTQIAQHQNFSDKSFDVKLNWDNEHGDFHVDPSIEYKNGDVTIPEGRTYFVYASAQFNISLQKDKSMKKFIRPQRISIRLCKSVYGYEETLLAETRLIDMTGTGSVVTSLRVGSHLHLSRDDKIYIRVTKPTNIIHDSRGNTFGLFPL